VAKKTIEALAGQKGYAPFARQIAKGGWIKPNKRIFDNGKISTTSPSSRRWRRRAA